jgi:hypothetical protein
VVAVEHPRREIWDLECQRETRALDQEQSLDQTLGETLVQTPVAKLEVMVVDMEETAVQPKRRKYNVRFL